MGHCRLIIAGDSQDDVTAIADLSNQLGYNVVAFATNIHQVVELVATFQTNIAMVILGENSVVTSGDVAVYDSVNCPVILVVKNWAPFAEVKHEVLPGQSIFIFGGTSQDLMVAAVEARSNYTKAAKLKQEVNSLKDDLEGRKLVERAKGILMDRHKMSEADAYKRIHFQARNQNKRMREIAESIITASELM